MEAVIFIGIQASGKSSFYKTSFFRTHVRINLDMLKTRNREKILLEACIAAKQPFVVDKCNPTVEDRAKYISQAKAAGFHVIGYYFQSKIADAVARNNLRSEEERVPEKAIASMYFRLKIPSLEEGFDSLYYVTMAEDGGFAVKDWDDEV